MRGAALAPATTRIIPAATSRHRRVDMDMADARPRGAPSMRPASRSLRIAAGNRIWRSRGRQRGIPAGDRDLIGELSVPIRRGGSPGILRFSEKSAPIGSLDNRGLPACHMWISAKRPPRPRATRRVPGSRQACAFRPYNGGGPFQAPPQDVPLAVWRSRSITARDLCWPMPCSTRPASRNGPSKGSWSHIIPHTAGIGSPT